MGLDYHMFFHVKYIRLSEVYNQLAYFLALAAFSILAQVSLRVTVRLKTR